ncbi:flavin-containing monooxygenase [Euzebya tangerina]|uniref:flavin-containing monooxygenase n=1 Tax=Euzebya tangerina TaxID=591198 RepID=UPI000E31B8DF|nr:NAD(P)/FAD-dependent oxidoreductase [Euzebya tangerina]
MANPPIPVRVAVVGAGFSGIAMALRLKRAGLADTMTILEAAEDIGGTWRENTYPGCACDVPSHLYSLSDEPYDWPRLYAHQPVIQAYLHHIVESHDLGRHIRFSTRVLSQTWDHAQAHWDLLLEDGETMQAEVVINAVGPLSTPAFPDLPGQDTFAGRSFHSSAWPADLDLHGTRFGIIGTGASALQIVPAIAGQPDHLTVFQRTPAWVLPRPEYTFSRAERWLLRNVPAAGKALRQGINAAVEHLVWRVLAMGEDAQARAVASGMWNIRHGISDPALREAVTPTLAPGCKRLMFSNTWYPTLERDDVTLETTAIEAVTAEGVRLADGRTAQLDVLVYGTGFDAHHFWFPMEIVGQDGRRLREEWADGGKAYMGTTVTGFPNLFFLLGPNTGTGHNSVMLMAEAQADYIIGALRFLQEGAAAWLMPTARAYQAFADEMAARHDDLVWATGCGSWYLSDSGVNDTIYPGQVRDFRRRLGRFDIEAYTSGQRVTAGA